MNNAGKELRMLLLLFLALSTVIAAVAQGPETASQRVAAEFSRYGLNSPTTTWTRTAFEAGVTYQDTDQIAVTTTNCPPYGWAADWYAHSVSWTSNGRSTPTKDGAPHHLTWYNGAMRDLVANGTYPVYANGQTYDASLINNSTVATVTLRLHCLDGTYPYIDIPSPQTVSIFDRIPVEKVVAPETLKGGVPLSVEIILSAAAPPSNTRVDLKWEGSGVNLISLPCQTVSSTGGALTCHVDVGAGATSLKLNIPTATNTGSPKQITITATSKPGVSQQATVTITK